MSEPKIRFESKRLRLPLDSILPVRTIKDPEKRCVRYDTVVSSIKVSGVVEPLMVFPQKDQPGIYLLLDGHLRFCALKELGHTSVECLISTDDESFTYNARISRLAPIQEHAMIKKAIQNGVPAEKIASALNLRLEKVQEIFRLLDGIHTEASDLLKDKPICPKALRALKKVSTVRQIEMAELMVSMNNFTHGYAEALLLGTTKDQLLEPQKKERKGLSGEEMARMQFEMETLERDFKAVEQTYGENMLNLTLVRGYVKKLLENAKVLRFLTSKHADLFGEFESIATNEAI